MHNLFLSLVGFLVVGGIFRFYFKLFELEKLKVSAFLVSKWESSTITTLKEHLVFLLKKKKSLEYFY